MFTHFWDQRVIWGQLIWQNQVMANDMNMFCICNISVRRTVIDTVHKVCDSNPRHTPPGSSKLNIDGTIRKSAYEFLCESGKKNDVM